MPRSFAVSPSTAARAAALAAGAFAAEGVLQLAWPQHTGSKVVGASGHAILALFIVALLASAVVLLAAERWARPGRSALAARAAAGGTALLGLTCVTSLAMGHDGVWFNVIAPLTNAAWLFGSIALAVSIRRARRVPAAAGIALPVMWLGTIPLATVGGGLLSAAALVVLARTLLGEARAEATHVPAGAVAAARAGAAR